MRKGKRGEGMTGKNRTGYRNKISTVYDCSQAKTIVTEYKRNWKLSRHYVGERKQIITNFTILGPINSNAYSLVT